MDTVTSIVVMVTNHRGCHVYNRLTSADFASLHGFMGNMESWKMEDQSSGSKSLHDIVRKMKGLHTEIHNA